MRVDIYKWKVAGDVLFKCELSLLELRPASATALQLILQIHWTLLVGLFATLSASHFENLLNHPRQPPALIANQCAILLYLFSISYKAVREVFGSRWITASGCEVHATRPPQIPSAAPRVSCATSRNKEKHNARTEQGSRIPKLSARLRRRALRLLLPANRRDV